MATQNANKATIQYGSVAAVALQTAQASPSWKEQTWRGAAEKGAGDLKSLFTPLTRPGLQNLGKHSKPPLPSYQPYDDPTFNPSHFFEAPRSQLAGNSEVSHATPLGELPKPDYPNDRE